MSILSEYLSGQARWREAKAEQYPEDERNEQSAEALKSLAAYVDSDDCANKTAVWFLGILEHEGQMNFGEKGGRLTSRYGFDRKITDSKQHDKFLAQLQRIAADDTYGFQSPSRSSSRIERGRTVDSTLLILHQSPLLISRRARVVSHGPSAPVRRHTCTESSRRQDSTPAPLASRPRVGSTVSRS